ncbi:flavin-dependent monooxygenase [Amycolatopsis ultiminotia]|uniref:Flavin-dependent monooxygenase n=1 Tax=Amycolatopsis ultiminotia TaxID=543629 RepID=A0ABP6YD60_9PSEU
MSAQSTSGVTTNEVIERAEALLPAIAQRAPDTERERRIPRETLDEIEAAGLNRILQPTHWGGLGLDFDAFFEVSWRIASACGSTGWVYSVATVQNWEMGLATEAARKDVFGATPDVWSCSAFNPRGAQVEPVADGWRLTGRWRYSSGCLHADWAMLGAKLPEQASPVLLLVPRNDFRIEDTWHVSGLRGTGSNDIVIDEPVFVPGHRYVPTDSSGFLPSATESRGSYGAPLPVVSPWGVVAPVLGMAHGALEAYERATRTRVSSFTDREIAKTVGPQMRISSASAALDAARALARQDIRELIERGARAEEFSDEDRVRLRRDHAYIVDLSYHATMTLARAAGAASLFETHPIQRFLRDVHAGSMQVVSNWDEQAESYGRVRLGLEPNGQMW